MTDRVTVLYSGHVQGVGFRYTVCALAARRMVAGWVRNEPDGQVRLVAEGAPGELVAFLDDVRTSRVGTNVVSERIEWARPTGGFSGFRIAG